MIWVRKGFVHLLSLILLIALVGAVFAVSINQTLGQPKKIENMLAQSKLYDHFVSYTADQAKKSEGDTDQSGSVSLSDAAVQAAAQSAFPAQLIQQGVNTFLDSNYDWLEGKTAIPNFKIDLSSQKAAFAQNVGQYVKKYTASLPACSASESAQLLRQQNTDPLLATCRPAGLSPAAVGAQVTERLANTSSFLSNPVITASAVNPNGNQHSQPYYTKLSRLPKLYRLVGKLPYILGALSILSAAGILLIAVSRRKAIRRVGIMLFVAGVVLVASKFIADYVLKKVERKVFNSSSVGQLQQSLTDFARRVESSMVRTDLWFGIAFLVAALVIFGILLATRRKTGKQKKGGTDVSASVEESAANGRLPLIKARRRLRRPFGDSIMPLGAKPGGEEPEVSEQAPEPPQPAVSNQESGETPPAPAPMPPKPKRRKPPRLIQ